MSVLSAKSAARIVLSLLVGCVFASCEHKDLCYDHDHMVELQLGFDWREAPDAAPQTMVAHFFTPDGAYYRRFEFTSRHGGPARVEAGEYMVLFHNGENEVVREHGSVFSDYMLGCEARSILDPLGRTETAPRPSYAAEQPVLGVPEEVWAGVCGRVTVLPGTKGQVLTLVPAVATKEYTVRIVNVQNMSDAVSVSAAVTGMSTRYGLSSQSHLGPPSTLPLEVEKEDDHTLVARFRAFGHCPEEVTAHTFTVYTSEKTYYNFDITSQMHESSDPNHVYIELEDLKLPVAGAGMSPSISGWDEVIDYDVPMN